MSDYDRYQETMMLWDLEAENQLERSQSRPKKTSSSRGEFDPAEHRPASELTAANMISSAQATRTGNMMQMKNQLAAMADQLNSTMSVRPRGARSLARSIARSPARWLLAESVCSRVELHARTSLNASPRHLQTGVFQYSVE